MMQKIKQYKCATQPKLSEEINVGNIKLQEISLL